MASERLKMEMAAVVLLTAFILGAALGYQAGQAAIGGLAMVMVALCFLRRDLSRKLPRNGA